jgi:WD40 repeat protein
MSSSLGDAYLFVFKDRSFEILMGIPDVEVIRGTLPFVPEHGDLHVSPFGGYLCLRKEDGTHHIYAVNRMALVSRIEATDVVIPHIRAFSPDETLIAGVRTNAQSRVVWRVEDGQVVARTREDRGRLLQWWCSDSRTMMVADGDGVHLWDTERDAMCFLPQPGGVVAGVLSPNGRYIAIMSGQGEVSLWESREAWTAELPQPLHILDGMASLRYGSDIIQPFAFTPDSRRLLSIAGQKELKVYDMRSGRLVGLPILDIAPERCSIKEDGKWVAVGNTAGQFTYLYSTSLAEAH